MAYSMLYIPYLVLVNHWRHLSKTNWPGNITLNATCCYLPIFPLHFLYCHAYEACKLQLAFTLNCSALYRHSSTIHIIQLHDIPTPPLSQIIPLFLSLSKFFRQKNLQLIWQLYRKLYSIYNFFLNIRFKQS